jgi:EAL domain-containing protein (putative c-di-GMP-specific phosphodiesterase class I)/GGDEF domain-containing protein
MTSLARLHARGSQAPADLSPAERFTRALLHLTRTVWHSDCTFDTAIQAISEAAGAALAVDRVSVWRYDRDASELHCLYCSRADGSERRAPTIESLSLLDFDYMAALDDVRTIDAGALDASASVARSHLALRAYLANHRIRARLDAPAFAGGDLLGLICFESEQSDRRWSGEESTFAASMGDYVAMAHEIARRRRAEAETRHLRLHDPSTDLPNLDYLVEMVRQRMAMPHARGELLAVVHLRVEVAAGGALSGGAPTEDEVMVQIALRLRRLAPRGIELARVHGNAFAFVLARNGAQGTAVDLAQACLSAVRDMRWEHESVQPRASAGIAFAEPACRADPAQLLRKAEEAADHANLGPAFGYEVFDIVHHETLVERLRIERALGEALATGMLEVHYQPEYDAVEHRWVGAEALLRWRDHGRVVPAAEFIGVAESCGLILPIGTWVLRRACSDAMQWPAGEGPVMLRVNVSARQFEDERLLDDVAAALADAALPPQRLCLELTETTLMADIGRASIVLQQLKALGVQLAIDDFGTGYAPLVYLKRFPIDVLKIDRSFVRGLPTDTVDAAIVSAVTGLAASLGIEVVAEGVETAEQETALQSIGVRRMQGWRYARSMDQDATLRMLESPVPQF